MNIEDAITLAVSAHRGQVDKAGATYILHPLRVMLAVTTVPEQIVAVLHDVLEDSRTTVKDLLDAGFDSAIVDAVVALTRREGESYLDFVARAKSNPIARAVKIADIRDNLRLDRIPNPTPEDFSRMRRYETALASLLTDD